MRLQSPDRLAEDIEAGLGELHWLYDRIEPSMRLRSEGVCGVASLAVAQHFRQQGRDVELIISSPRVWVDEEMRHVFPLVRSEQSDLALDLSFTQFLSYAGMSPGYVANGGEDLFPELKFAHIHDGDASAYVDIMTTIALDSMSRYEAPDPWFRAYEFEGMNEQEIRATYAAIWDPAYFDVYRPSARTLEAGRQLAALILPEHARLVD